MRLAVYTDYKYRRDDNLNVQVSGAAYGAPYVREWTPSLW